MEPNRAGSFIAAIDHRRYTGSERLDITLAVALLVASIKWIARRQRRKAG